MNEFPNEKVSEIKKAIDTALAGGATPIAAFDADGTLWDTDIGENFFEYQIQNKLVDNLPTDPWKHYYDLKAKNPPDAYIWLAQVLKGKSLEEVREWNLDFLKASSPVPIFSAQKEIISHLQSCGVEVYVVTASIKWAVEAPAQLYDIPQDHVLGVKTKIIDNNVSTEQDGAITWKEGKVEGLLEATAGKKPFFASGNTMGDITLLESASHVQLVMNAAKSGDKLYETENELLSIAKERSWYFHQYN